MSRGFLLGVPAALCLCLISFLFVSCQSSHNGAEVSPGEMTFKQNCQACHRLPKAEDNTDAEWPALVDRYGQKAKLSQTQIELITSWLLANN